MIGQITGIRVNETLPDTFFETADEVELIDLSPDELLKRLREGKVYVPQQIERALGNFFKKGNLIALRELALRQTADRVDAQMREYREEKAITPICGRRRIVVAIGPTCAASSRALRETAGRLIDAEWHAIYPRRRGSPAAAGRARSHSQLPAALPSNSVERRRCCRPRTSPRNCSHSPATRTRHGS